VTDRENELRAEAAKYLRLAQTAKDPKVRAQLTAMAEQSLALAQRPLIDLKTLFDLFNEDQIAAPAKPALQQQHQRQGGVAIPEEKSCPQPPSCPTCGKIMRLEGSAPAVHYINLDQLRYACDCGGMAEKTVARRD